jgi:hypothetical protein
MHCHQLTATFVGVSTLEFQKTGCDRIRAEPPHFSAAHGWRSSPQAHPLGEGHQYREQSDLDPSGKKGAFGRICW